MLRPICVGKERKSNQRHNNDLQSASETARSPAFSGGDRGLSDGCRRGNAQGAKRKSGCCPEADLGRAARRFRTERSLHGFDHVCEKASVPQPTRKSSSSLRFWLSSSHRPLQARSSERYVDEDGPDS